MVRSFHQTIMESSLHWDRDQQAPQQNQAVVERAGPESTAMLLTYDGARRVAADGTGAWTSMQIDGVFVRIALTESRTEKAVAESDKQL